MADRMKIQSHPESPDANQNNVQVVSIYDAGHEGTSSSENGSGSGASFDNTNDYTAGV